MYFLWKRTPHGSIRISCNGFSGFVNMFLPKKSKCCGMTLAEGENASVTLVLSSDNADADCFTIEKRLASVIAPLGLRVSVIWADRGTPGAEWYETMHFLSHSPWPWMFLTALIALGVMAGWKGLFWTFFWGTAAWFVSKVVISFMNKREIGFFSPLGRR